MKRGWAAAMAIVVGGCANGDLVTLPLGDGAGGSGASTGGAPAGAGGSTGSVTGGGGSTGDPTGGDGGSTGGPTGGDGGSTGGPTGGGGSGGGGGVLYVDMDVGLTGDDLSRWNAARDARVAAFNDECPDALCEGDYSNASQVALTCAMTTSGYVKQCTWVMGGSIHQVDGATGAFFVNAQIVPCTFPVEQDAGAVLAALEGGSADAFYLGIGTCNFGPTGTVPPVTGGDFAEVVEYLSGMGDSGPWEDAVWNLSKAFQAACPDTFCKGTWRHITPLRLTCVAEEPPGLTGQVTACQWTFAAANLAVSPDDGQISTTAQILTCPVAVNGQVSAVVSALSVPDPLQAVLPGAASPLADVLAGCL